MRRWPFMLGINWPNWAAGPSILPAAGRLPAHHSLLGSRSESGPLNPDASVLKPDMTAPKCTIAARAGTVDPALLPEPLATPCYELDILFATYSNIDR